MQGWSEFYFGGKFDGIYEYLLMEIEKFVKAKAENPLVYADTLIE